MRSFTDRRGASLSYVEHGEGAAVLALHGAYSTHSEIEAFLEPVLAPLAAHRRIYADLPGMGDSPGHESITGADDVVALLADLVDDVVGDAPLIVVGHSYGAHIARGLAARRPGQVAGLVLICPLVPDMEGEEHAVAVAEAGAGELIAPERRGDFLGYFVVQTAETARRFEEAVAPSIGRFDPDAVERIVGSGDLTPDPDAVAFDGPVLVLLGRLDAFVGYRRQLDLADRYPHASLVLVDSAGHALPHERPELLRSVTVEWLRRLGA